MPRLAKPYLKMLPKKRKKMPRVTKLKSKISLNQSRKRKRKKKRLKTQLLRTAKRRLKKRKNQKRKKKRKLKQNSLLNKIKKFKMLPLVSKLIAKVQLEPPQKLMIRDSTLTTRPKHKTNLKLEKPKFQSGLTQLLQTSKSID
jgi:hypothetical protein